MAYRGWPVLAIGVRSLLAALAYMGGPRPIAYTPFGELTVFVFFGLVAVMGTDWVLTGSVGAVSALASVAIGALAAAALAVNNHRDIAHDRLVGRRTFAVTFGEAALAAPVHGAAARPVRAAADDGLAASSPGAAAAAAAAAGGLAPAPRLRRCPRGTAFNEVLFRTFRLELWFAALLSAGALLGRMRG